MLTPCVEKDEISSCREPGLLCVVMTSEVRSLPEGPASWDPRTRKPGRLPARSIEDDAENRTPFPALGPHAAGPSGRDRPPLVMTTHNQPGSVHDLIASFST